MSDTKQVFCDKTGINSANGSINETNVEIRRSNGKWSSRKKCDLDCHIGYELDKSKISCREVYVWLAEHCSYNKWGSCDGRISEIKTRIRDRPGLEEGKIRLNERIIAKKVLYTEAKEQVKNSLERARGKRLPFYRTPFDVIDNDKFWEMPKYIEDWDMVDPTGRENACIERGICPDTRDKLIN